MIIERLKAPILGLLCVALVSLTGCGSDKSDTDSNKLATQLRGQWLEEEQENDQQDIRGIKILADGKVFKLSVDSDREIHLANLSPVGKMNYTTLGLSQSFQEANLEETFSKIDITFTQVTVDRIKVVEELTYNKDFYKEDGLNESREYFLIRAKAEEVAHAKSIRLLGLNLGFEKIKSLIGSKWVLESRTYYADGVSDKTTSIIPAEEIEESFGLQVYPGPGLVVKKSKLQNLKSIVFENNHNISLNGDKSLVEFRIDQDNKFFTIHDQEIKRVERGVISIDGDTMALISENQNVLYDTAEQKSGKATKIITRKYVWTYKKIQPE